LKVHNKKRKMIKPLKLAWFYAEDACYDSHRLIIAL
jgi:hypothetical protein